VVECNDSAWSRGHGIDTERIIPVWATQVRKSARQASAMDSTFEDMFN
jgi:hypothetical protein